MTISSIVVTATDGRAIARRARDVGACAVILRGPASASTIELIRVALDAAPTDVVQPALQVARLIDRVAYEMGVTRPDIVGQAQSKRHSRARRAVAYLGHIHGRSASSIGRAMGDRDHSTILSQIKHAETMMQRDPAFRMVVNRISAAVTRGDLA